MSHFAPPDPIDSGRWWQIEDDGEEPLQTAEKSLLVGILKRALLDYFSTDPLWSEDAREWFFSEDDEGDPSEPFTFGYICLCLELDKSLFQQALLRPKQKAIYLAFGRS